MKQTDLKDQSLIEIPADISNLLQSFRDFNLEDYLIQYKGMSSLKMMDIFCDKGEQTDQDQLINQPDQQFPLISQPDEITLLKKKRNLYKSETNLFIENNEDYDLDYSLAVSIFEYSKNNLCQHSKIENEAQQKQENPQQDKENKIEEQDFSKLVIIEHNKNIDIQEKEEVQQINNNKHEEICIDNLNESQSFLLGQLYNFGVQLQPQQLQYMEVVNSNNTESSQNPQIDLIDEVIQELKMKNMIVSYQLAKGGEAEIYVGTFLNEEGQIQECVFRICLRSQIEQINEEINIAKNLKNTINVIKYYQSFSLDIKGKQVGVFIQEKGKYSLESEFQNKKDCYTVDQIWKIILNLNDGLVQLRRYRIIHADIKLGNILINSEDQYVYSDFGISRQALEGKTNVVGLTEKYCPPEQKLENHKIDFSADLYALGKTITFLLTKADDKVCKDKIMAIINNHMIKDCVMDRTECLKIIQLFYQQAKQQVSKNFLLDYQQKIDKIIELDRFDNMRDLKYEQCIKLAYLFLNLQITLDLNDLGAKLSQLIGCSQENKEDLHNIHNRALIDKKILNSLFQNIYYIQNEYQNVGKCEESLKFLKLLVNIIQLGDQSDEDFLRITFDSIGQYFANIGNYKKSVDFYLEQVYIVKSSMKINFSNISSSLNNIGTQYFKLGYLQEAFYYFQESLDLQYLDDQRQQDNLRGIALTLNNIGNYYQQIGDLQQALIYLKKSLKIQESLYDKIHPDIALSINNIGVCYQFFGDFKKALEYYFQSLDLEESLFKDNLPFKATIHTNIGTCYEQLGYYEKALTFQNKSLSMRRELFEENNIEISDSLNNMGNCYVSCNQFANALECYEQAFEIRKKHFSGSHHLIANSLNNMGYCYEQLNNYKVALNYYEQSLNMRREIFSEFHPDIADSLNNIGTCYLYLKQSNLALKNYRESLEIRKKLFPGGNHHSVCQSFNNIGMQFYKLSNYKKALRYLEEALRIAENISLGNHPLRAILFKNVGSCYYSLNDSKISLDNYLKSLAINREIYKENNYLLIDILELIGIRYEEQGNKEQAFIFYEEILNINRQLYPQDHPSIVQFQKKIQSLFSD